MHMTLLAGVRNSVGMTWHPDTQQFFFNMIERDLMGDNRSFLSRLTFSELPYVFAFR